MSERPPRRGPFDNLRPQAPPLRRPVLAPVAEPEDIRPATRIYALSVVLFIFAFNAWLFTSPSVGKAYLREALSRIGEVDRLVRDAEPQLRAAAADTPGGSVALQGYPVSIELPSDFAKTASAEQIRDRLLEESAARVYDDGPDALRAGDPESDAAFSQSSVARRALAIVDQGNNRLWAIIAAVFATACAATALRVAARSRDSAALFRRLGLGAAAAGGVVAALALAGMAFFALLRAIQGEYLADQVMALASGAFFLYLRSSLIIAAAGAGLALLGYATARGRTRLP